MRKLILIIFLYPFMTFSQWIDFAPKSAGTGGKLFIVSKDVYYYRAWNNQKGHLTLYFTNDGGKNWLERKGVPNPAFINDSVGFGDLFYTKRGFRDIIKLGRTQDYAATWPDSFDIMPDSFYFNEVAVIGNNLLITYQKPLNLTILIGNSGNKISQVSDKSLFNIHFINDSVGFGTYLIPESGSTYVIYKTSDAGYTWTELDTLKAPKLINRFQFTSEDTAYALTDKTQPILKSVNGGSDWDTTEHFTDWTTDFVFINSEIGFALVWDEKERYYSVYYTTDGANSWKQLSDFITSKNIRKIDALHDNDSVYLFFSFPGGGVTNLYKGSFAFTDLLAGVKEITKASISNYTLYPNPVSQTLTLRCESDIPCTGMMQLYSLQGQLMLQKEIKAKETETDISIFPKGLYLVKVVDEKGVWVSKVVKE